MLSVVFWCSSEWHEVALKFDFVIVAVSGEGHQGIKHLD